MSAFLSESYIPDIDQRMAAYRRLTKMTELQEVFEFNTELIDRYGELPREAGNLLSKIVLKILSKKAGISRLDLTDQHLLLHFSVDHLKNSDSLVDLILSTPEHYALQTGHILKVKLAGYRGRSPLRRAKNILKEIAQHVKS